MSPRTTGCGRWLLSEFADYALAAWLIAGVAVIVGYLAEDLLLCSIVAVVFVGVTLLFYFKLARPQ